MGKVYITNRILIPLERVNLKRVRKHYQKRFYDEHACGECEFLAERHCGECDTCPSYLGLFKTWNTRVVKGEDYLDIPAGDVEDVENKLNISLEDAVDNRANPPMPYKIKWKGKLDHGQKRNGIKTADQVGIVDEWMEKGSNGFIEAPPRTGKCLTGDSYVSTNLGFMRFDELIHKSGSKSFINKISTSKGIYKTNFSLKKKSKTIAITTSNGFNIEEMLLLVLILKKVIRGLHC
jgi:hypothetical protein